MSATQPVPIARLLSASLRVLIDEMHVRLAAEGHPGMRPAYGFALNAVGEGTTASALASSLGMTKQGAAKLIRSLVALGYVSVGDPGEDLRVRPIRLTARGRDALDRAARIQDELEGEWAAAAGTRAVREMREALETWLADRAPDEQVPLRPLW